MQSCKLIRYLCDVPVSGINWASKENIHCFGAWNGVGWLQGFAVASVHKKLDHYTDVQNVLKIDFICVGPGRFCGDEYVPPLGTGTSLVKHIVSWAKKQGNFRSICLETNAASVGFYRKVGFEPRDWYVCSEGTVGWMELCNQEDRWEKLIGLDKYEHRICESIDDVPEIYEWQPLWKEMGPPLWGYVNCLAERSYGNAMKKRILGLPFFESPIYLLDSEGKTLAHYIVGCKVSRLDMTKEVFGIVTKELKMAVWNHPYYGPITIPELACEIKLNISEDPVGWASLLNQIKNDV